MSTSHQGPSACENTQSRADQSSTPAAGSKFFHWMRRSTPLIVGSLKTAASDAGCPGASILTVISPLGGAARPAAGVLVGGHVVVADAVPAPAGAAVAGGRRSAGRRRARPGC